jgi:glutamate--cysteine ligase
MYFVKREDYIDASGQDFKAFMRGELPAFMGQKPTMNDWADHLTTLFPEVRLKKYLEMRGADSGPWNRICALPALWAGLLYDQAALDAATDLIAAFDSASRNDLRNRVAKTGLKGDVAGRPVKDWAKDMLEIARLGLKGRNMMSGGLIDERGYLDVLFDIAESGITPAEHMLEAYHGRWGGDVSALYYEDAY